MIPRLVIAMVLTLVATSSSFAHDSDRIEQLEREVAETKQRLSVLESKIQNMTADEELELAGDGWKSVTNWKKLTVDMSALSAKKILGDPHRVVGVKNAVWYYNNGGVVWITDGNVDKWSEPE